jgi:hypothetical protein
MVSYFIGGAMGSALGNFGWHVAGWAGVCTAGVVVLLPALAVVPRMHDRRKQPVEVPAA